MGGSERWERWEWELRGRLKGRELRRAKRWEFIRLKGGR